MNIKPLERFATQARRDLLSSVDARATAVLAAGSVTRAERPEVVRKLEAEIIAHGHEHVIDKVAYTWFNRIIALRFMDARGYTDAGIVSPAQGQSLGQPEILAEAKRGNLDADVVNNKITAQTILGLLDGTRRSTDAEGEAYALLLTEYCRHWHKSMPFMFEREGDYTELLVPAGLLADGAIVSEALKALTEEVCGDVEVIGWLYQFYISERKDEVFAGFKKNRKAGANEIPAATQLFTPHWIVRYLVENSVGRLWMLNRPSSRLVDQMEYYIDSVDDETDFVKLAGPEELTVIDPACGSGHMLTYAFDLIYAIYEEEGYAPADIPGLILTRNLHGTELDPRAGSLAAFALVMKARGRQRAFFAKRVDPNICVIEPIAFRPDELELLSSRSSDGGTEGAFWTQFGSADTLGSLIRPKPSQVQAGALLVEGLEAGSDLLDVATVLSAEQFLRQARYLSAKYVVAIANPPYMGTKSTDAVLQEFVKKHSPDSKADLYAAFIERCEAFLAPGGVVAMVTMQSWMFLSTYEKLRRRLIDERSVWTMAHFGAGAFDTIGGEVVATTAFVMGARPHAERSRGVYVRATGGANEAAKSEILRAASRGDSAASTFVVAVDQFEVLPGAQFAYWLPEAALTAYRTFDTLGQHAYGQPGLQTSDNARFTRQWFEVSRGQMCTSASDSRRAADSGARWFPLVKGGDYRKWYGNLDNVVNWRADGEDIKTSINEKYPYLNGNIDYVVKDRGYFFRESLTYNRITAGRFAVRHTDSGTIFDVAGSAVFPDYNRWGVLGFLCSTTVEYLMRAQNPTFTVQSGDVAALPFPASHIDALGDRLASPVRDAVSISRSEWDSIETSWSFLGSPLLNDADGLLSDRVHQAIDAHANQRALLAAAESSVNRLVATTFGLESVVDIEVAAADVTLGDVSELSLIRDLLSYAVGCMFGRYSLDVPGLMIADQGATLGDHDVSMSSSRLRPDADNVIPFVDDGWFEDDVIERFRQFLRVGFGVEHFEENLRFIEESLGVKTLRDYFISKAGKSKFYDDHVQRYRKRPIYWMFSSPKGSFNALVYMHRYNPSTVSTVLNEYLREYRAKLEVALANADQAGAAGSIKDQKEADRLRKVLAELSDYEHDVLYPLATQQVAIDLDDGVKANYPKFYPAIRKIAGLEAPE